MDTSFVVTEMVVKFCLYLQRAGICLRCSWDGRDMWRHEEQGGKVKRQREMKRRKFDATLRPLKC